MNAAEQDSAASPRQNCPRSALDGDGRTALIAAGSAENRLSARASSCDRQAVEKARVRPPSQHALLRLTFRALGAIDPDFPSTTPD
jgi:hypothetical protein